jgi:hypothetical protein
MHYYITAGKLPFLYRRSPFDHPPLQERLTTSEHHEYRDSIPFEHLPDTKQALLIKSKHNSVTATAE